MASKNGLATGRHLILINWEGTCGEHGITLSGVIFHKPRMSGFGGESRVVYNKVVVVVVYHVKSHVHEKDR